MGTEKALRELGSSGLYRGHWNLLKIVELRASGFSLQEAVKSVARTENVSTDVIRKRIGRLLRKIEKTGNEAFRALWPDGKAGLERITQYLLEK